MKPDIEALRDIAWKHWDPIGLLGSDVDWRQASFKDEYDNYLKRAVRLYNSGATEGRIAGYLIGAGSHRMGMGNSKRMIMASVTTAKEIVSLIETHRGWRK